MHPPIILNSVTALRAWRESARLKGKSIGLVPTMGALHAGHLSLVKTVREQTDLSVVSIFVNPTQFAPNEDFSAYPRTFEADYAHLNAIGADAVYVPPLEAMYPKGFVTTILLEGPAKVGLEDAFRPTHFAGVATVVAKLLLQALPDVAIFGEKDFQQLAVIRQMAQDLDVPVQIAAGETMREVDGLALSSRNVYLSQEERGIAPLIHQTLRLMAKALRAGADIPLVEADAHQTLSKAGFLVDYIAVRDAKTLHFPAPNAKPENLRLLVAAKLGKTRLIDNINV